MYALPMKRLVAAIRAKWEMSRMFCAYCGAVPVETPRSFCSELCQENAALEDKAA